MYAPQGYIDSTYFSGGVTLTPMPVGTFTYNLDGSNAPRYQNSGVAGTLNSATINADFRTLIVTASLGLNIGTDFWAANYSGGMSLTGGALTGTATVIRGAGLATTCATCSGSINGMFTGQNFAGAILTYNLFDKSTGSTVYGDAALTRLFTVNNTNPAFANAATPSPTGLIVIDCGTGCLTTVSPSAVTTVNNVLTQYSIGSTTNGSSVTVSCPLCTATASGQFASSGIYYGTWTSGTYSSTNTLSGSTSPAYWITGPEAGPLYLPQALLGTASYALDAGQVSNAAGTAGTVNSTTALTVNFTNQTVGINLDASVTDVNSALHNWVATATAPLTGNQGIGGGAFHASTYGGSSNGLLSVSVDGSSLGTSGTIDGQLTGSGLTGAIISFNLGVTPLTAGYADSINGIAAFSGTAQNINTPYRSVLMATYDTSTLTPALGFYFNNAANAIQDPAGNLTKFDSNFVNSGSGKNVTLTNTGSTLTDFGKDSASGISWGRWQGGTLNVTSRAATPATSTTTLPLSASLHWITEPIATSAVTLPLSGTYNYTLAGGTKPTDNLGNIGTLNAASVTANFTAQTVNVGVNVTVNSATLNATATNAPIIQNTVFYASSVEPLTSSSYLNVSCSGTCGGATGGTVIGKFTGAGAIGVAMSYGLQNGTSVVNGVAALHR
jgi:hypothetical protein